MGSPLVGSPVAVAEVDVIAPEANRLFAAAVVPSRKLYPVTPAPVGAVQVKVAVGQLLEEGRERMWKAFMAELRSMHLGMPTPRRSVFAELQKAFESVVKQ